MNAKTQHALLLTIEIVLVFLATWNFLEKRKIAWLYVGVYLIVVTYDLFYAPESDSLPKQQ